MPLATVYNVVAALDPCHMTTQADLEENRDVHWSTMTVDVDFWKQLRAEKAYRGYVFEEWEPLEPDEEEKPNQMRIRIHEQVSSHYTTVQC